MTKYFAMYNGIQSKQYMKYSVNLSDHATQMRKHTIIYPMFYVAKFYFLCINCCKRYITDPWTEWQSTNTFHTFIYMNEKLHAKRKRCCVFTYKIQLCRNSPAKDLPILRRRFTFPIIGLEKPRSAKHLFWRPSFLVFSSAYIVGRFNV